MLSAKYNHIHIRWRSKLLTSEKASKVIKLMQLMQALLYMQNVGSCRISTYTEIPWFGRKTKLKPFPFISKCSLGISGEKSSPHINTSYKIYMHKSGTCNAMVYMYIYVLCIIYFLFWSIIIILMRNIALRRRIEPMIRFQLCF